MLELLGHYITTLIQTTSYWGIFLLMLVGSSVIPIPSEVVLPFSGFLVHMGKLNYYLVVIVAAIGDTLGSLILYSIGYFLEETVVLRFVKKYGKYILISVHEYQTAAKWFTKYGDKFVFFGKFLPGFRALTPLPAGLFEMRVWKFIIYIFASAIIWASVVTYIGVYLGSKWQMLGGYFKQFENVIIILLVIVVVYYIYRHVRK